MSVNPSHLRPGNWIHCKGSSHYGIVTGDLLALLEKEEKMREKFEYVELTGEFFKQAGLKQGLILEFNKDWFLGYDRPEGNCIVFVQVEHDKLANHTADRMEMHNIKFLHQLQQFYEIFTGSELPLPESAKLIPQELAK